MTNDDLEARLRGIAQREHTPDDADDASFDDLPEITRAELREVALVCREAADALRAEREARETAERERDDYKKELELRTHQVITCGVFAHHSDVSKVKGRKCYTETWATAQSRDVLKLREERDALAQQAAAQVGMVKVENAKAFNTIRELAAERDALHAENERLKGEKLELLFFQHREYDENPAAAFANRRRLTRAIATLLGLDDAATAALMPDAEAWGADIIKRVVRHANERAEKAEVEIARLRIDLDLTWSALSGRGGPLVAGQEREADDAR